MGAILLNGCEIGKNCIIGAGALVTQGSVIEDGSVVMGNASDNIKSYATYVTTSNDEDGVAVAIEHFWEM